MVSLEIHEARKNDTFQNIIRLHPYTIKKLKLNKYDIIWIERNGTKKKVYGWLRTIDKEDKNRPLLRKKDWKEWILMDDILRERIFALHPEISDFNIGDSLDFNIGNASKMEYLIYYGEHSNPAVKIGFWLAIWLTIISVLASIILRIL